jgi:hypothetical protein
LRVLISVLREKKKNRGDEVIDSLFQSRFADALLRELAGVTIPPERIYGLGTGLVFDKFHCNYALKLFS